MPSLFSRPQPRKKIDRRRSLAGIPVLNDQVTVQESDAGTVCLVVKRLKAPGILARIRPQLPDRRIELDELGSFVLREIDGHNSVQHIVNAFVRHYKTNRREAELCVVDFLKSLMRRQVIAVGIE